jgi:hypothetical protein
MTSPFTVMPVSVTIDGVTYIGNYYVQDSIVHVQSLLGTKSTRVGWLPSAIIAELLLSEMVKDI